MARFGTNTKFTIASEKRPEVHAVFVQALQASPIQPGPDLEVYRLEDGANVGVYYVPTQDALDAEAQRKGAWLEFLVSDPDGTGKRLDSLGVARVEYHDREHAYYQLPGGPVFRLAGC
jgi:hypothetical protein